MLVALGSLFTHSRTNALRVGVIMHACSAVVFATLYTLGMIALDLTAMPRSFSLSMQRPQMPLR